MKENTADNCAQAAGYLDTMFENTPEIQLVGDKGLFAGQVDYKKLPWLLRFVLKVFIKEPGGDYRDLEAVRNWATGIHAALVGTPSSD